MADNFGPGSYPDVELGLSWVSSSSSRAPKHNAFDLARLGRDRLANLADELGWALIETDDRAPGIGRFGIEIEHIFHAGDEFAVHLGKCTTCVCATV